MEASLKFNNLNLFYKIVKFMLIYIKKYDKIIA